MAVGKHCNTPLDHNAIQERKASHPGLEHTQFCYQQDRFYWQAPVLHGPWGQKASRVLRLQWLLRVGSAAHEYPSKQVSRLPGPRNTGPEGNPGSGPFARYTRDLPWAWPWQSSASDFTHAWLVAPFAPRTRLKGRSHLLWERKSQL